MTHPEKERNFDHSSKCGCEPNSEKPCSLIEFPKWLELELEKLDKKFEKFHTANSIRASLQR